MAQEPERTLFVCGTRAVWRYGHDDYRVCCATCDKPGDIRHYTASLANRAAVRLSGRPCSCGAR